MQNISLSKSIIVLCGIASVLWCATLASAQTAPLAQPDIQTYTTPTSSATYITAPSGYKSEVISTYDGSQYHTYATSTPLTDADMQKMQSAFEAEEASMQKFFEEQQNWLEQQEQLFQFF